MRSKGKSSFISLSKRRIYEKERKERTEQHEQHEQQQREEHEELFERFEVRLEAEQQHQRLQIMKRNPKPLKRGARMSSEEDSLGSYTGINTNDEFDMPVQDADDL